MVREPIERLKEKVLKENLWLFIFRLLRDGDLYAYEIRQRIREEFGFLAGRVTSYKVLYLLEKGGYVEAYEAGRRRYYRLTSKGLEQLKKAQSFLHEIYESVSK
ncbi:helix-turn-helix transcriptional regulator [Candidatus Bathyarchaeota archaeon]|nr:helix-turn-helix transcriptional regulator [Candidatus Bathyarchaeota archaeon]